MRSRTRPGRDGNRVRGTRIERSALRIPRRSPASVGAIQPVNGTVEFLNCTAAKVTGDLDRIRYTAIYVSSSGIEQATRTVQPDGETTVVHPDMSITNETLYHITAFESDGREVHSDHPNAKECNREERIRAEPVTASFVGQEQTGENTYEVTYQYTNRNDETLRVPATFEGGIDDTAFDGLEPGTHQLTVEWTPESDDDRLVWDLRLEDFGLENRRVSSDPPATATTTDPGDGSNETNQSEGGSDQSDAGSTDDDDGGNDGGSATNGGTGGTGGTGGADYSRSSGDDDDDDDSSADTTTTSTTTTTTTTAATSTMTTTATATPSSGGETTEAAAGGDEAATTATTEAATAETEDEPATRIEGSGGIESSGQPGFGIAAGLVGLLSGLGIAVRRR